MPWQRAHGGVERQVGSNEAVDIVATRGSAHLQDGSAERRNDDTPVGQSLQDAVALEQPHGFAQRRAANAQPIGEPFLGKPVAGPHGAARYVGLQRLDDHVYQARGGDAHRRGRIHEESTILSTIDKSQNQRWNGAIVAIALRWRSARMTALAGPGAGAPTDRAGGQMAAISPRRHWM